MTNLTIGRLVCQLESNPSADICYILSYEPLDPDWVELAASQWGCNLAVVSNMDWDNDLTPWPAPGQPPGCPPFRGEAASFLAFLKANVLPEVERRLITGKVGRRVLLGVSLSGLFSLWAWLRDDTFSDVGSISGSVWYEGFVGWLASQLLPRRSGLVYLSLGDRESATRVKAFQSVGIDTQRVVALLRRAGIDVFFEWNPGTHYAPFYPRLKKAMDKLFPPSK